MRDWAKKTSEASEPGKRAPTGSAGKSHDLRDGPRLCCQTMRRAMGKARLGVLGRREEMGERESRVRHLAHQRNKARPGGHDQRHHKRTGGCWTLSRRKHDTLVIIPCETWTDFLHVDTEHTQWEQVLVFVGMAPDLSGSSWASVRHRLNQGTASMRKWAPIFKSKCVNGGRKIHLLIMSVWASVLWGSALWTLTKTMTSAIGSWSARTTCAVLGVKRGAEEAMDQWWRRLHRVGHPALKSRDQSLSNMAERLIHRWRGHVARLSTNHWLAEVVRARVVQCWRWAQQRHTDKSTGVHPYKIFRWEDQLCRWHSEGCTKNPLGEHRVVERRPRPSIFAASGTVGFV